ncbi:unnamed protein product [Schistocephalus solidus]|uniref:Amine oxidase n=1 Tax=Schistocephalus solidus TaxID=70667 RepID=A0A183TLI4_SCHSO|nr:unnamed protein product [Schistocephalus solidus]
MTAPTQLQLVQLEVDAEEACSFQHFCVRDLVLPSQLQYFAEAAEVDVFERTRLLLVNHPGVRSIQQYRQNDKIVHLEFGAQVQIVLIPDDVLYASEGLAGFGDPVGDLIIDFGAAGRLLPSQVKFSTGFS